uniref:Selenoprotein O n=1 Tax=Hucho hucho TaxID=62062 RepID=A0A4W5NPF0_9TELE
MTVRTARLVAQWQCFGFCHGVLNTDNMSILGLTVDYGPFGFIDRFDPEFVCNASNRRGRYLYQAQPSVCRWNLARLGPGALGSELHASQAGAILDEFMPLYLTNMRRKLGLLRRKEPEDQELVSELHNTEDHWLGLSKVFALTKGRGRRSTMRVDLRDFEGGTAFAEYSDFRLGTEKEAYKLNIGPYRGNAGDAIRGKYAGIDQNGFGFSTTDKDNDGCSPCIFGDIAENMCSFSGGGGWWYSRCGSASLNGDWHPAGEHIGWASGPPLRDLERTCPILGLSQPHDDQVCVRPRLNTSEMVS